jgi:AraC-like DNA-binding protein
VHLRRTIVDSLKSIRKRLDFTAMDGLAGFLDGPRARGAFLLRSVLEPPWSLRIEDESQLTVVAVVRGAAWIISAGDDPVCVAGGDVAVVCGSAPYTVADSPRTTPQVRILPGQVCVDLTGASMEDQMSLGVRTWGNSATGSTVLLTGTYQGDGEVSRRLLAALPRILVLRAGEWESPIVTVLADEVTKDELGQEAVLDRLLDVLLVSVLRASFARAGSDAPSWYAAHTDPVVGPALRLLENNPQRPWTVADLARCGGVSRATFAKRFAEVVGEPPIAFLTGWRLALAADLLREPDTTVARVARAVGYGSPFTFSTAFKRHFGQSPQEHRRRAALTA